VLAEGVVAEVVEEVADNCMDVVGVVLGVVVFDQDARGLDAVVVALAWFGGAGPGEIE
jgi:hypothetical protein